MEETGQIMHAIGKLEGAVGTFMQAQTQNVDRMNRIDTDIETIEVRVRSVERKQYTVSGGLIVIWSVIQLIITRYFH